MEIESYDIAKMLCLFDEDAIRARLKAAVEEQTAWDPELSERMIEVIVLTVKTGFEQGVWAAVHYLNPPPKM